MTPKRLALVFVPLLVAGLAGCGPGSESPPTSATATSGGAEAPEPVPSGILAEVGKTPWKGDFDGMVERRLVRVVVPYNSTSFFFDGATPRGILAEALAEFEAQINRELRTGRLKVYVLPIPVSRDRLLDAVENGFADLAAANLTVTPDRLARLDASDPTYSGVREVLVTGPGVEAPATLADLSGRQIWVRASSSYHASLQALDARLRSEGKAPIEIHAADEQLETEDLLEMTAAGILPMTVADDYIADLWRDILPGLTVHDELAIRDGGNLSWMFRKNSPKLAEVVNRFVRGHRAGTTFGNVLLKRYYQDNVWIRNSTAEENLERLRHMNDLFRQYGAQYEFDWLLIAAQGFQESGLDQSRVSPRGAIGVMQMLKSTAADPAVGIPDIEILQRNIEAGNKYMRWILDTYFADAHLDELNRHLFAFAGYNAGPNRIARLRAKAAEEGYDPDVWFRNVEVIVAREVGREPVQYVSNIFKYYLAYQMSAQMETAQKTP